MKSLPVLLLSALMANAAEVKISELPETNAPSASAVIPIVDAAANWKVQKANLLGSLTNWAKLSTNGSGLWAITTNSTPFGPAYVTANQSPLVNGFINLTVLTNSDVGDFGTILNFGWQTPDPVDLATNGNYNMINLGDYSGTMTTEFTGLVNCHQIYNLFGGNNNGMSNVFHAYFYADTAGVFATNSSSIIGHSLSAFNGNNWINNSSSIEGLGDSSFSSCQIDNSQNLLGLGAGAMGGIKATNWSDVIAVGRFSALGLTGNGLSHIFIAGSAGKATNSNDWVAGDANYNYFFPGASSRFDNIVTTVSGVSSLATDAFLTFTATGRTNSLGKVAVARFDGTTLTYVVKNNSNTPVYTNTVSVGHATEIVQAGGAIVITAGSASGTMSPF